MDNPSFAPPPGSGSSQEQTGPGFSEPSLAAKANGPTASSFERNEELQCRLARLGWPADRIQTASLEVTDHWEDLEAEGREQGLDVAAATKFADERLGDPAALAQQFAETMRR